MRMFSGVGRYVGRWGRGGGENEEVGRGRWRSWGGAGIFTGRGINQDGMEERAAWRSAMQSERRLRNCWREFMRASLAATRGISMRLVEAADTVKAERMNMICSEYLWFHTWRACKRAVGRMKPEDYKEFSAYLVKGMAVMAAGCFTGLIDKAAEQEFTEGLQQAFDRLEKCGPESSNAMASKGPLGHDGRRRIARVAGHGGEQDVVMKANLEGMMSFNTSRVEDGVGRVSGAGGVRGEFKIQSERLRGQNGSRFWFGTSLMVMRIFNSRSGVGFELIEGIFADAGENQRGVLGQREARGRLADGGGHEPGVGLVVEKDFEQSKFEGKGRVAFEIRFAHFQQGQVVAVDEDAGLHPALAVVFGVADIGVFGGEQLYGRLAAFEGDGVDGDGWCSHLWLPAGVPEFNDGGRAQGGSAAAGEDEQFGTGAYADEALLSAARAASVGRPAGLAARSSMTRGED